jgi:hypothetical protein
MDVVSKLWGLCNTLRHHGIEPNAIACCSFGKQQNRRRKALPYLW